MNKPKDITVEVAVFNNGAESIHEYESRRQSERGKKKAGTVGDLKHALIKICLSINSTAWPEFKEAIKDRDEINDLYESTTDPINIHDYKLVGDCLLFRSRDGIENSRPIKRIRSILSEIKRENGL